MKKLILIALIFVSVIGKAQFPFPVDTTHVYRYMFVTDSAGFCDTEYLVRKDLLDLGGGFGVWGFPAIDSTNYNIWICETPEIPRFINFPDLAPIKQDIIDFGEGKITLAELKEITALSTVPLAYKKIIGQIKYINVNKFRIHTNFKNFIK